MRLRRTAAVAVLASLTVAGVGTAHASGDRRDTFAQAASRLRAQWDSEQAAGVPATSLAPLRAALSGQSPTAAWWSPAWLEDDGSALLKRLSAQTASAWNAALAGQRAQAEALIAQWTAYATEQSSWLPGSAVETSATWTALLGAATTPAAIEALSASWQSFIAGQRTAVTAAQQAKVQQLQDELRSAGGPQAVLDAARRLVAIAATVNLDPGNVAALAARLSEEIVTNADATVTGEQLLAGVTALQSLVNLNDQVAGQVRPLLLAIDQAEAEATPNGPAFAAQDGSLSAQFTAARTADQLNAVAAAMAALQTQVTGELAASQCGHPVGAGKVITISLSLQEMVFYQDGCVVKATPVSTGRPQLRTPTGTFQIFNKQTPFEFISPWPPSSPFYYYPSKVSWVMEFAAGGYFIHDAPWESQSAYGPGSEDNLDAASHGCVHTPTAVMQWAFDWTPPGTPVVISA